MIKTAHLPFGSLQLTRYPETSNASLQAWDAADELLLSQLLEHQLSKAMDEDPDKDSDKDPKRILVLHDHFGALTCSLSHFEPVYYNDSIQAEIALKKNLQLNQIPESSINIIEDIETLASGQFSFDLVLMKMPKQLNYFEYLLHVCLPLLACSGSLIVSGMTRQMPPAVFAIAEKLFGNLTSSKAVKKARLLFLAHSAAPQHEHTLPLYNPEERERWEGLELIKLPNTFARKAIDSGSALLAGYIRSFSLNRISSTCRVLDMGCGNGLLSLSTARWHENLEITAIDESRMAVQSANAGFDANSDILQPGVHARFMVMDGGMLDSQLPRGEQFDLILCNPPFHQHGTVNRRLALRLLLEAKKRLTHGGSILVVSNSSLGYHGVMEKHFSICNIRLQKHGYTICQLQV